MAQRELLAALKRERSALNASLNSLTIRLASIEGQIKSLEREEAKKKK